MKENQITKSNVASAGSSFNRRRVTSNRISSRHGNKNTSGKVDAILKSLEMRHGDQHTAEIFKVCKDLKVICVKMDKLEKEKQKLIFKILDDGAQRKKVRC